MPEYMHLIGTEQIQSAANTMKSAADEIQRAANTIHNAMESHERVMQEFMSRMDDIMGEKSKP